MDKESILNKQANVITEQVIVKTSKISSVCHADKIGLSQKELILLIGPLLRRGKHVRFRVRGRSMSPTLKDMEDEVELVTARYIEKGDIVLAQITPNQFVLHRVIEKKGDHLMLMGDGNLFATERCHSSDIIGSVCVLIRKGHRISVRGRLFRVYSALWVVFTPIKRLLGIVSQLIKSRNEKSN